MKQTRAKPKGKVNQRIEAELNVALAIAKAEIENAVRKKSRAPLRRAYRMLLNAEQLVKLLLE